MWMRHRYVHRLYGALPAVRRMAMRVMGRGEFAMLRGHKDLPTLRLIKQVQGERESLLSVNEAYTLFSMAKAQGGLRGAMAEVGVYQGCSAKLISRASDGRRLYLFDTFAGLPEPSGKENAFLRRRQYHSSLEDVQAYLGQEPAVIYRKGLFPDTAQGLEDERFSFVHLDVDLRSSTLACLEFFVPRMVPGGIILTHDFSYLDGVRQAFLECAEAMNLHVIELPTSQAFVVCNPPAAAAKLPGAVPSPRGDQVPVHDGVGLG